MPVTVFQEHQQKVRQAAALLLQNRSRTALVETEIRAGVYRSTFVVVGPRGGVRIIPGVRKEESVK